VSSPYDVSSIRNYNIAISGDVFRWIIEYACEEVLKRVRLGVCAGYENR
jgi:cation-transporting P-type ATPase 13A2